MSKDRKNKRERIVHLTPDKVPRWYVAITYRTNNGPMLVKHNIEEMYELQDLMEHTPHWETVIEVKITKGRRYEKDNLTVEEAAVLRSSPGGFRSSKR